MDCTDPHHPRIIFLKKERNNLGQATNVACFDFSCNTKRENIFAPKFSLFSEWPTKIH